MFGVWRLAFGSKMMTGDGLNPDGDGRRATGDPLSLAIAAGENRWVWVWVLREQMGLIFDFGFYFWILILILDFDFGFDFDLAGFGCAVLPLDCVFFFFLVQLLGRRWRWWK